MHDPCVILYTNHNINNMEFGSKMPVLDDQLYMTFAYKPWRYDEITKDNMYSILDDFIVRYFNTNYIFSINKKCDISLQKIFNMVASEKIKFMDIKYSDKTFMIEVLNDPGLELLKLFKFDNIKSSITVNETDTHYVFSPNEYMPTCIMSFFRDLIIKNIKLSIDGDIFDEFIDEYDTKDIVGYYNDNNSNGIKIDGGSTLLSKHSEIKNIIKKVDLKDLKDMMNKIGEKNFCELSFTILDDNFLAAHGNRNKSCDDFIKYASTKYSFMKDFGYAYAYEGGFTFQSHHTNDPLNKLMKYTNCYISSRYDLRGMNKFRRQYSTNGWYMWMLHYWLNEYGVKVSDMKIDRFI